jgi:hypothetical protein
MLKNAVQKQQSVTKPWPPPKNSAEVVRLKSGDLNDRNFTIYNPYILLPSSRHPNLDDTRFANPPAKVLDPCIRVPR